MDIKFIPCPFCGETENIHLRSFPSDDKFLTKVIFARVECGRCGGQTGNIHADTIEEANEQAILLWNDRWKSNGIEKVMERVKAAEFPEDLQLEIENNLKMGEQIRMMAQKIGDDIKEMSKNKNCDEDDVID